MTYYNDKLSYTQFIYSFNFPQKKLHRDVVYFCWFIELSTCLTCFSDGLRPI